MQQIKRLKDNVSTHFKFGENWAAYAKKVSDSHLNEAQSNLGRLSPNGEIRNQSFLDIGCGSGIHSLSALRLGAAEVLATDIDPVSTQTTESMIGNLWDGDNYDCRTISVFQLPDITTNRFDIVYSWGVLHHTGSMWEAIEASCRMVRPGGQLAIAIYVKTPLCKFWKHEKALFSKLPKPVQMIISWVFCTLYLLRLIVTGKNPVRVIRNYQYTTRGMNWYRDIVDWLGGYPYESAKPEEIISFVEDKGFRSKRIFNTKSGIGVFGTGCGEFVFEQVMPTE